MIIEWRGIKEWPEYFISNTGEVKNNQGKLIKVVPNKNRRNYCYVYHHKSEMRPRAISVHRLVARHFIPNPEGKRCVNHIDNDTMHNHVDNLEWVTHQENTDHMIRQGRKKYIFGSKCSVAILNEKIVKEIKELKGVLTYMDIAKKYNTNYSNVAHIMRGSRWRHVQ